MRQGWLISPDGSLPYGPVNEAMHRQAERRLSGEVPDTVILLEHRPVFTAGRRSKPEELLWSAEEVATRDAEVCRSVIVQPSSIFGGVRSADFT